MDIICDGVSITRSATDCSSLLYFVISKYYDNMSTHELSWWWYSAAVCWFDCLLVVRGRCVWQKTILVKVNNIANFFLPLQPWLLCCLVDGICFGTSVHVRCDHELNWLEDTLANNSISSTLQCSWISGATAETPMTATGHNFFILKLFQLDFWTYLIWPFWREREAWVQKCTN